MFDGAGASQKRKPDGTVLYQTEYINSSLDERRNRLVEAGAAAASILMRWELSPLAFFNKKGAETASDRVVLEPSALNRCNSALKQSSNMQNISLSRRTVRKSNCNCLSTSDTTMRELLLCTASTNAGSVIGVDGHLLDGATDVARVSEEMGE